MKRLPYFLLGLGVFLAAIVRLAQADAFVITDIRLEGLQRVSAGSLFQAFPINIGDNVDEKDIVEATRSLFKTGYFKDIQIGRDGDVLVVVVDERPSISAIEIEGNDKIGTDDLKTGLKQSGLSEGDIFQRATLDRLEQELVRQYISQGRYGVTVETQVKELERNRVALTISIYEGKPSTIEGINIVGNEVFDDETLLDRFTLRTTNWHSFYKNDDKYSREKLAGDLERLRSKYLNNGYINFNIESTQVSITPDKAHVFITVNLVEGDQYAIGDVSFSGDLAVSEQEFMPLLKVHSGDVFSNERLTETTEALTDRLGDEGYTFANVNAIPEINEDEKRVDINLFVDPGKRAYVRRISFTGNTKTNDEVLRREMRQMESAWASNKEIERSKIRLQRLGFFKGVNVETPKVPDTDDQIDVNYQVEEQPSGSVSLSLGFSGGTGLTLGANVSQKNFLGTGKNVSIGANQSDRRTSYNFSYLDPYYTVDGVSRGFDVFFREFDYEEDDVSSYSTDSFGGNVSYGFPLSESQFLSFRLGYEGTSITTGSFPVQEISSFLTTEGTDFSNFLFTGRWNESSLNKGVFATRGASQTLALELSLPGSDLSYYKLTYKGRMLFPLTDNFTLRLRTELGYGDAYGSNSRLPFYKHFFAGGFDSVRGFKNNTLGPRSTPAVADPDQGPEAYGGNVLVTGSTEILFPMPFVKDNRSFETGFFFDVGNVFDTDCSTTSLACSKFDAGELRYSFGIAATWLSGFGPLSVSLASALNEGDFEDTEFFQFSFGTSF
jgi:outer membrane protein insertion porin family